MKGSPLAITKMLKGRGTRFVYLIGDEGAILIYIEGGAVQRRLFAPTPEAQHTNGFVDLMKEYPSAPVYVLIDLMDQSYIRHAFPPVTSLGLNKIVQRRLERDFSKDDIKGALNLGREKKGRKDWNFLLISLASTKELQGWLGLVYDLPNRFMGVFLVPVESEYIIADLSQAIVAEEGQDSGSKGKKTKPAKKEPRQRKQTAAERAQKFSEWKILISHNKVGGYRQVVLKDGHLVFTRMTQAIEGSVELQAGSVEQEILNTIEYLKRLSYSDSAPLDIYLITAQEVKAHVARERFGKARMHILTPHEAADLLQLKQAVLSADRFGDVVLASAFGMAKKHRLKLTTPFIAKLEALYKGKTALTAASVLLMIGIVLYMIYEAASIPGTTSEIAKLEADQKRQEGMLTEFRNTADQEGVNTDEVNDLVNFSQVVNVSLPTPMTAARTLLPVIDDYHILFDFDWTTTQPAGPLLKVRPETAADTSATSGPTGPITMTMTLDVTYERTPWDIFVRQTDTFLANLGKAFPDYSMEHDGLPGQSEGTGSLTVNFDELERRENTRGSQTFPIKVTFKGPSAALAGALPGPPP